MAGVEPKGKQPKLSLMGNGKLGSTWEGVAMWPCAGEGRAPGWCWEGVGEEVRGVGYVLKTDAGVAGWWLPAGCRWGLWKPDLELNYELEATLSRVYHLK